jgi:hypothetical protein
LKEEAPDRTLCKPVLEEAVDLSWDRLRNEWTNERMNEWVIFGNGNNSAILPMRLLFSLLSTPFSTTLHLSPYPLLGSFAHIQ